MTKNLSYDIISKQSTNLGMVDNYSHAKGENESKVARQINN